MLDLVIMMTPGRQNEFIRSQNAKVCIAALPNMDVKTRWNSTLQLLQHAYNLRILTHQSLHNPKYSQYRALFTTQDEWTIVNCVIEVLRPVGYWTLWMSKRRTVTFQHVITVYNNMFDHMYGVMRGLAKKKIQWKEDLFFAVKLAAQKLSKYYTEVTPMTGMLLSSAYILDPFRRLRSFRM
jgi:hypothetical protein